MPRNNPHDPGGINWHPPIVNAGNDTIVSINDSVRLHGRATDSTSDIINYAWDIGSIGKYVETASGDTTIIAPVYQNLNYQCVLKVTNGSGIVVRDTVKITVLQDAPLVSAGNDTLISIKEAIRLSGGAKQQFGSIVTWEWKIGPGNWTTISNSDTIIMMPATEQTLLCSLAVTDDDMNRSVDEIKLTAFIGVKSVAVSPIPSHSLILRNDGTLWGCGSNGSGQLGDGTMTDRYTTIEIATNVESIAAGARYTLFVKTNGTLWACGSNTFGHLCDGTNVSQLTPKQVMSDVKNIVSGGNHNLILKNDNTLWACGYNTFGQFGVGDTVARITPVLVMSDVKRIASGSWHSLAVKSDNTLWGWGYNWCNQIYLNQYIKNPLKPMKVMDEVETATGGSCHTLILKTDGSVWARGNNYYGQIGDGTYYDRPAGVKVMDGVVDITAASGHSMFLKADNTLWVSGDGASGDGKLEKRYSPVKVMTNVKMVATSDFYTLFIKRDGTLWGCGINYYGPLGTGDTISRLTPIRLIPPEKTK